MKKIFLPKELYDQLDLSDEQEVEVVENNRNSFTIRAKTPTRKEDAARVFLIPTAISTFLFFIASQVMKLNQIHLSGTASISTGVLVIANVVAMTSFIIAFIKKRKELYHTMRPRVYWRTFPSVILSVFIIVTLALVALFWFLNQLFYGLSFDVFTSMLIFAIFSAILNYLLIFTVDTFSIQMMINMLIMVSVGGLVASMAANNNQYWWQKNFSLLGTSESNTSLQFNMTLVVSAALMIALFDYIFVSIREKLGHRIRFMILQILLTLCAVSIALVGLIPNNGTGLAHVMHDVAAQLIVLFMSLSILGIRWFLPDLDKNLYRVSYGLAALIIFGYFLWHPLYYLNLTAFEILSFSLSFAWIMLLINTLVRILFNPRVVYHAEIFKEESKD
ncbi:DUF998 domain-containing protein [Lactococcus garvieae]|uniref:DUF998 domain-containing protein n=1 Tax=Lactococcus garvieae TaxID=1363 RepID=UPI0009BE1E3F|nr:DUF998 domain-containing protein [Lactococcus garvieae]